MLWKRLFWKYSSNMHAMHSDFFYRWRSIITCQLTWLWIQIIIIEKLFYHETKSIFLIAQSRIKLISVEAATQDLGKILEDFLENQFHVEKNCRQLTQISLKMNLDENRYRVHLFLDFSCTVNQNCSSK